MTNKELETRIKKLEEQIIGLKSDVEYFRHLDRADKDGLFDCDTPKLHHDFKFGDRVQFKSWEEMEKEFGLDWDGDIGNDICFIKEMKHLCGTYATIEKICGEDVRLKDFTADGITDYLYLLDMLKPATDEPRWTFTDDEKVILRNLPEECKFIGRDKDNDMFGYDKKPSKHKEDYWGVDDFYHESYDLGAFRHLFQSIKWEDDEPCEFRKFI